MKSVQPTMNPGEYVHANPGSTTPGNTDICACSWTNRHLHDNSVKELPCFADQYTVALLRFTEQVKTCYRYRATGIEQRKFSVVGIVL